MKIVDLMFKHCKLMDGKGKYKIEKLCAVLQHGYVQRYVKLP